MIPSSEVRSGLVGLSCCLGLSKALLLSYLVLALSGGVSSFLSPSDAVSIAVQLTQDEKFPTFFVEVDCESYLKVFSPLFSPGFDE